MAIFWSFAGVRLLRLSTLYHFQRLLVVASALKTLHLYCLSLRNRGQSLPYEFPNLAERSIFFGTLHNCWITNEVENRSVLKLV